MSAFKKEIPPQGSRAMFEFSKENDAKIKKTIKKYPEGRQASAVKSLLDMAQRQNGGWLPKEAMDVVAERLDMPPMKVYEVATFYTMFNLEPIGKHHVKICGTTPCWLRGSDDLFAVCKSKLGVTDGQTSADGNFTVSEVECMGACVNAPMVQIGDDYLEDLDIESFGSIIDALQAGKKITPGPQIQRQKAAPASGLTSLVEDLASVKKAKTKKTPAAKNASTLKPKKGDA